MKREKNEFVSSKDKKFVESLHLEDIIGEVGT